MALNFLFNNWEAKHTTIGLFETNYTTGVTMHVKKTFDKFQLKK
jgi:hypothetical protein